MTPATLPTVRRAAAASCFAGLLVLAAACGEDDGAGVRELEGEECPSSASGSARGSSGESASGSSGESASGSTGSSASECATSGSGSGSEPGSSSQ